MEAPGSGSDAPSCLALDNELTGLSLGLQWDFPTLSLPDRLIVAAPARYVDIHWRLELSSQIIILFLKTRIPFFQIFFFFHRLSLVRVEAEEAVCEAKNYTSSRESKNKRKERKERNGWGRSRRQR